MIHASLLSKKLKTSETKYSQPLFSGCSVAMKMDPTSISFMSVQQPLTLKLSMLFRCLSQSTSYKLINSSKIHPEGLGSMNCDHKVMYQALQTLKNKSRTSLCICLFHFFIQRIHSIKSWSGRLEKQILTHLWKYSSTQYLPRVQGMLITSWKVFCTIINYY